MRQETKAVPGRIFVLGAGSIGLYLYRLLACHLREPDKSSELDVTLLARRHTVDALEKEPLLIEYADGRAPEKIRVRARLWDSIEGIENGDLLIIATKAHQVQEVLSTLHGRINDKAMIALCQNGLGIQEMASKFLPDNPVMRLLFWLGVRKDAPGKIRVAGAFKLDLSAEKRFADELALVKALLDRTGLRVDCGFDPLKAEWQKALCNIAVNGLLSVVDAPNGALLDCKELNEIARLLLGESRETAAAIGIDLSDDDIEQVFTSLNTTRSNINATLQDLRAGQHPELEYLNGAVVRLASHKGVNASANETICKLVNYLEKSGARTVNREPAPSKEVESPCC